MSYAFAEFVVFVVLILFVLFLLFVFMNFLCTSVPAACGLAIVKEGFALLLWIILALLVVGFVCFTIAVIWEYKHRTLLKSW